jgi:ribonucleoside-triphosphate reductase
MDLKDELSKFIFTSKYARYRDTDKRRETWDEAVTRLEAMHLKKFAWLKNDEKKEIKEAFNFVREQRAVPSMRSLQFGGKAIEAHEARMFNCAVRHVDSLRSFSEIFYLLLCGNGVGIGVSKKFLKRLPDLVDADDKTGIVLPYAVEDTIEGWADSVEALLGCYFRNTPYTGRKIVFDYSKIRKKGAPLKTGGGKAPGYRGLKKCSLKNQIYTRYDYRR